VDTPCHTVGIRINSELAGVRDVYARGEHSLHGVDGVGLACPGVLFLLAFREDVWDAGR
jgi:hypothetical protein